MIACAPAFDFARALTPSGVPCADMPIVPAGSPVEKPHHRLQPVMSAEACRTEAERLESLRRAACRAGADAVIEAANEEIRGRNGTYGMVASGTAVRWKSP
jgi:hypothetical protein